MKALKENLLNIIVRNSMHISGSIEDISGMASVNWAGLPEETALTA